MLSLTMNRDFHKFGRKFSFTRISDLLNCRKMWRRKFDIRNAEEFKKFPQWTFHCQSVRLIWGVSLQPWHIKSKALTVLGNCCDSHSLHLSFPLTMIVSLASDTSHLDGDCINLQLRPNHFAYKFACNQQPFKTTVS